LCRVLETLAAVWSAGRQTGRQGLDAVGYRLSIPICSSYSARRNLFNLRNGFGNTGPAMENEKRKKKKKKDI